MSHRMRTTPSRGSIRTGDWARPGASWVEGVLPLQSRPWLLFASNWRSAIPRLSSLSVHPGVVATRLWRRIPQPFRWFVTRRMAPPEVGALPLVRAATDPSLPSGGYLAPEGLPDAEPGSPGCVRPRATLGRQPAVGGAISVPLGRDPLPFRYEAPPAARRGGRGHPCPRGHSRSRTNVAASWPARPDVVRFVYPLTNANPSPTSFTIDPTEHFHSWRHATANGWDLIGAFHSHPGGPGRPSKTDLASGQRARLGLPHRRRGQISGWVIEGRQSRERIRSTSSDQRSVDGHRAAGERRSRPDAAGWPDRRRPGNRDCV